MVPRTSGLARVASAAAVLTFGALTVLASAGSAVAAPPKPAPVVVVGMAGVRWDDVGRLTTPALWGLSQKASVGLVAARGTAVTACPAHGWLTVSTGARAGNLDLGDRACNTLADPGADGLTPGWSNYVTALDKQSADARAGLLGDALAKSGTVATGIGPGAAIALSDSSGRPVGAFQSAPSTSPAVTDAVRDALRASRLVVIDTGDVRDPGRATVPSFASNLNPAGAQAGDYFAAVLASVELTRAQQVGQIDARVGAVLAATHGSGATVLVVSLADSGRAALQLMAATGPAPGGGSPYGASLLTSGSTRQVGLVQSTDITPTLFAALGLAEPAAALPGASIVPTPGPQTATARVGRLVDTAQQASQATRLSGAFTIWLISALIVLFLIAAVVLTRVRRSRREPLRTALRGLQVAAVAFAAAPVASFLTGLVPWWRASSQVTAFWLVLLGWVAVITALSFVGPWRRHVLGSTGVVAAVTVGVLVLDMFTGSTLVVDSPMGAQRILAARFYGISNPAFALLATAGLLLAVVVASALLARGRRALAALAVAAIGLVITVVDVAPSLGSDFGGPPAIILGFAILALVVSGRKVTWRVLLLIAAGVVVVMGGVTVSDWLRPAADRSHIGRFLATSLNGGVWDVVYRKLSVNYRVLTTSWRYPSVTIGGGLLTALVVAGPGLHTGPFGARSPLAGLEKAIPLLRPAVVAVGVALTVGFLVNDSGIIIPATGIAVAVPLLIAATAQWRLATHERNAHDAASTDEVVGRTSSTS